MKISFRGTIDIPREYLPAARELFLADRDDADMGVLREAVRQEAVQYLLDYARDNGVRMSWVDGNGEQDNWPVDWALGEIDGRS